MLNPDLWWRINSKKLTRTKIEPSPASMSEMVVAESIRAELQAAKDNHDSTSQQNSSENFLSDKVLNQLMDF